MRTDRRLAVSPERAGGGGGGGGVCLDAPQDVSITEKEEVSVLGGGGLCPGILHRSGWRLHPGVSIQGGWVRYPGAE